MDTYRITAAFSALYEAATILKQTSSNIHQWSRAKDFEATAEVAEREFSKLMEELKAGQREP